MARGKKTEKRQQREEDTTGVLELGSKAETLPSVQLKAAIHYGLVREACDLLVADRKKLLASLDKRKYRRAAREVKGDIDALSEEIAPKFGGQLPFTFSAHGPGELRSAVMNAFVDEVKARVKPIDDQNKVDHARRLLDLIGDRVSAFAQAIAEHAFQAGLRARADTAEALAFQQLQVLRGAKVSPEGV